MKVADGEIYIVGWRRGRESWGFSENLDLTVSFLVVSGSDGCDLSETLVKLSFTGPKDNTFVKTN